jgi:hypothetical protein
MDQDHTQATKNLLITVLKSDYYEKEIAQLYQHSISQVESKKSLTPVFMLSGRFVVRLWVDQRSVRICTNL